MTTTKLVRYQSPTQRTQEYAAFLLWAVAVAILLNIAFGPESEMAFAFWCLAMLFAWGVSYWRAKCIGVPMADKERKRLYATELLSRPLWHLTLLFAPAFALGPQVARLLDGKWGLDVLLISVPVGIVTSLIVTYFLRLSAARLLARSANEPEAST